MAAFIPVFILAIIFGSITLWRMMAMSHKERMAQIERGKDAQGMLPPGGQDYVQELEQRVQHLETIVCSVDFELNAKLNRLASVQLQIGDAATRALAGGMAGELPTTGSGKQRSSRPSLFELEVGQRLADRFVIQRMLGTGGMGAVYLASDERLGESVALKIMHGMALLDPAAGDRLRREASAARRISHPNVVKIHDVGDDAGHSFLAME
jgi:serine/threonine-protein kinase